MIVGPSNHCIPFILFLFLNILYLLWLQSFPPSMFPHGIDQVGIMRQEKGNAQHLI